MDSLGPEFDAFVRERSTALLRTAYLLVGDRGHAEDLVQTALLRTARRWRHASADPAAYARRVLVNLAKDRWRNRSRRPREVDIPDELRDTDPGDQVLLRQVLQHAVLQLPARQRAVLVLRYFQDLTVDEAADALGCSPGTVKSQTHHALAKVRQLLGEQGTDLKETEDAY